MMHRRSFVRLAVAASVMLPHEMALANPFESRKVLASTRLRLEWAARSRSISHPIN
jgi:hypothetical protein